ncbi:hypothetical protein [Legionella drozanskii]|uniref:Uncharacterized protein n=1 Tax=Legionella drozanskii LLAP-1 TaxID=1212489 RepID=A0A0W0SQE5_9GAMM|nr:hypothetical protein [Legionella drozanskii]KTC85584.1 hypothetical protein Ldro_1909 [Legionella drozanskii LLAP-1]
MKISDVKTALNQYVANVSYLRSKWKESHIKVLEIFYNKINGNVEEVVEDRELTDEEYIELAIIIRGKNSWTEHPSSITLGALANKLGGKKAVNHFKSEKLSAIYLRLLEEYTVEEKKEEPEEKESLLTGKDEEHGYLLAQLLDALTPIVPSDEPQAFLAEICAQANKEVLDNKLQFISKLVDAKVFDKSAYLLVLKSNNAQLITDLLILLSNHGLCKEINLEKLESLDNQDAAVVSPPEVKKLVLLRKILAFFGPIPLLMMQTNLTALFKNDELWSDLLGIVEGLHSAEHLKSSFVTELFAHPESIRRSKEISRVIAHFRQADWELEHCWNDLLKTGDIFNVELAASKLCQLTLDSFQERLVLDCLFAVPHYGVNIAEGVYILISSSHFDEKDLRAVLEVPEHAEALAEGIVLARKSSNYNTETRNFISQAPAFALGLASVYKLLDLTQLNTSESRGLVLSRSSEASVAALILQRMSENNLFNKEYSESYGNLKRLYENKLIGRRFSGLQTTLLEAKLFNQSNFDLLCENAEHCKDLAEASSILASKDKLTQSNLELLFENAADAKNVASILCGEELQSKQPKHAKLRDAFFPADSSKSDSSDEELDKERSSKLTKKKPSAWFNFVEFISGNGQSSEEEEDTDEEDTDDEQKHREAIVTNP